MNSTQLKDSKIPCSTFMKTVCDASNTKSETNIKDRILKKLNHIASYIHCSSDIKLILSFEKQYLNPGMNCIELYKQERDITPANKCIKKQQFYSTKRKRLSKVRLGKPTIKEKNEIASTLLSQVSLSMPEFELS